MKKPVKRMVQWAVAAMIALAAASTAQAQLVRATTIVRWPPPWIFPVTWKCVHADGQACASGELGNPWFKQVFITSTGFADSERDAFWSEFDRIVGMMTGPNAGSVWSVQERARLLFVGYFVAGGPLGAPDAAFGGKIAQHPIRGYATSLNQDEVYDRIAAIQASDIPSLRPFTAGVLFNTYQTPVTANAAPPSFVQRPFGVAKFTRADLNERGAYITTHELAHAGLNFLDEYVEQGFDNLSIRQLDVLTPLALFDWTWGSFVTAIGDLLNVYDYNISDILAGNGNDNIALSAWPATVATGGYGPEYYGYEGGMFFGRGTWHMRGSNLMNDNYVMRAPDDGFAFAHSGSQQRVVDTAFDGWPRRPNDRLRTAGPMNGWKLAFGSTTHVMMYDGDKNNHVQPTQAYVVQVGWYERHWRTCWAGFVPYPCYDDVWTTAQKSVAPSSRYIDLKLSSLYGLVGMTQGALCAVGITEVPKSDGSGSFHLCDQDLSTVADNFLPTVRFPVPYQDVDVPASQWFTTYWWRFATQNAATTSGYTGWSSFYRSL